MDILNGAGVNTLNLVAMAQHIIMSPVLLSALVNQFANENVHGTEHFTILPKL